MLQQQLEAMLVLQDKVNTQVNKNWRAQNFPWYRAIWVESAELLDHYGWKWWKKQTPDMEQVKLELVDIWHFGLSLKLEQGAADAVAEQMQTELTASCCEMGDFRSNLEAFTLKTLSSRQFDVQGFLQLMADVALSFDDLYRRYIGKNVLNRFRQDHGYQQGSYQKLWAGREDNEHLVELADALDAAAPDYSEQLYRALSNRYCSMNESIS